MSAFEFTILAIIFLISLSIVWSSLRSGITPVPSSRKARKTILTASQKAPVGTIIELGSGWGNLALALAKEYPERQVIGYELSPIPWLVSVALQRFQGIMNLTLRRQNFLSTEFPEAALIVCYLYPGGMEKLAEKIWREKPDVKMLISNTFALPGTEPDQTIRLDDLYRSPIYVYRLKDNQISRNEM